MNLTPDQLPENGYILLDRLDHNELIPFVQEYIKKRNWITGLYVAANAFFFLAIIIQILVVLKTGTYQLGDVLSFLSFGFVFAFMLIPVHEFIHVLAYKTQGARQTSYDANLRKFYFMAVADRFVADRKEFRVVALAPFLGITAAGLLLLTLLQGLWTFSILSTLLIHTAFCSGDFGLLSYFEFQKNYSVVTYDDKAEKISFFYGKPLSKP